MLKFIHDPQNIRLTEKTFSHSPLKMYFVHTIKCFLNESLLSWDEAQEPSGEEAVVDDEGHLSVYEPLWSQFPESSFGPFSWRIHWRFPLLHPRPVLTKATQRWRTPAFISKRMQWGCISTIWFAYFPGGRQPETKVAQCSHCYSLILVLQEKLDH